MTSDGGEEAFESTDGMTLLYVKQPRELLAKPLSGGRAPKVIEFVSLGGFAVVEQGIYYSGRAGTDVTMPLFL